MENFKPKKSLLWLEDEPKTVIKQLNFAKQHFHVEHVSQLGTFADFLEESVDSVKGIILDVMLRRIHDLESLQEGVDTNNGFEAGWRVLEHLRSQSSKFHHIPVLVLSVRDLTEENKDLLKRLEGSQPKVAPITFIGKRETASLDTTQNWNSQFEQWVLKLKNEGK